MARWLIRLLVLALAAAGGHLAARRHVDRCLKAASADLALPQRVVARFDADDPTWDEFLCILEKKSGIRVRPDWVNLQSAGITPRTPIVGKFHLRDLSVSTLLWLPRLGAPRAIGSNGDLLVESRHGESIAWQRRKFYIADLLQTSGSDVIAAELVPELKRLIVDNIAPYSWVESGGSWGTIDYDGRDFIVGQSSQNLNKVATLLAEFRAPPVNCAGRYGQPPPARLGLLADQVLDVAMPRLRLRGCTLGSAIEQIRLCTDANIVLTTVEKTSADTPVPGLDIPAGPLVDTLQYLLTSLDLPPGTLSIGVDNDVVWVGELAINGRPGRWATRFYRLSDIDADAVAHPEDLLAKVRQRIDVIPGEPESIHHAELWPGWLVVRESPSGQRSIVRWLFERAGRGVGR